MTADPDDRIWSEFGFVTPMEVEQFREWEAAARDLCACSHMRQEHFPDRCSHVRSGPGGVLRLPCQCKGWTAPEHAPEATLSHAISSGVHRTAETGEACDGRDAAMALVAQLPQAPDALRHRPPPHGDRLRLWPHMG